jgi:hypothetical protein
MQIGKQNVWYCAAITLIGISMWACIGCGGAGLATVEGTVTFDGQPVENGSIVFEPADGVGPATGGMIERGKYLLDGENRVPPGKKIIRITAARNTGKKVEPMPGAPKVDEVEQFIPPAYNSASKLTCEVAAGRGRHDFALTSETSSPTQAESP